MEYSSTEVSNSNGAAVAPAVAPCPLNDLPQSVHEYLHALERRVVELENTLQNIAEKAQQNREAMKGFGAIVMSGPGKMFISALPKDMQKKLQDFFEVTP